VSINFYGNAFQWKSDRVKRKNHKKEGVRTFEKNGLCARINDEENTIENYLTNGHMGK